VASVARYKKHFNINGLPSLYLPTTG